ncbi:RING finger protein 212B-like [Mobula hypostoma]|uniref:RING finger protein 212B-like n=1 Tax=Mobula hypostoma TaxID=723540 RepID=UPI002FC30517
MTPRPVAITSPSSRVTPKQTPQSIMNASRSELISQVTGSSVSRSGGLVASRGTSVASGRSTPRDIIMNSPSTESGDSLLYRSLGRTPTLLTLSLSGGRDSSQSQGLGDLGLLSHSAVQSAIGTYTNPLQLGGTSGSHQTTSVSGDPRQQMQLNTTPQMDIFRQPSAPPSRSAAV